MHSAVFDSLSSAIRRSLVKLGADISMARRKRSLTVAMMAERVGVSKGTYLRAERGDPTVAMGTYAMALFALGLGPAFADVAAPGADEVGLMLDEERLPKRVRVKTKQPTGL